RKNNGKPVSRFKPFHERGFVWARPSSIVAAQGMLHVCHFEIAARRSRRNAGRFPRRWRIGHTEAVAVAIGPRGIGGGGAIPARTAAPAVLSRNESAAADAGARTGPDTQGQLQGVRRLPRDGG